MTNPFGISKETLEHISKISESMQKAFPDNPEFKNAIRNLNELAESPAFKNLVETVNSIPNFNQKYNNVVTTIEAELTPSQIQEVKEMVAADDLTLEEVEEALNVDNTSEKSRTPKLKFIIRTVVAFRLWQDADFIVEKAPAIISSVQEHFPEIITIVENLIRSV